MRKRLASILLVLVLLVSMCPAALAVDKLTPQANGGDVLPQAGRQLMGNLRQNLITELAH